MKLTRVGPYEVVGMIARGGMAEVYLGRLAGADGFRRDVAIKRVLPEYTADESFIDMFRDEARITAQLRHGNIVQVLEFRHEQGQYFLILEYVEGPSLATILRGTRAQGERIQPLSVAYVVAEVARALDYAHRKRDTDGRRLGIVHRDISASNVLVSREGHVKLTDFGIARAAARISVTGSGLVKGKVSYLAPEIIAGRPADERSDLFSLGALGWEMLCGQPPFEADTFEAKMQRILMEPLPPVSTVIEGIPEALGAVIDRLLKKHPEQRHSRAGEVVEALTPLLSSADQPAVEDLAMLVERIGLVDPAYASTRVAGFQPPRLRALVVERSKTVRAIIRSALDPWFEVVEVDDGEKARRALEQGPVAFVVSQQLLPGGASGIELCQELRALPSRGTTPFVLLATDSSPDLEERARAAGVSAVMTKSEPAKMVKVIRELAARVTGQGNLGDTDTLT